MTEGRKREDDAMLTTGQAAKLLKLSRSQLLRDVRLGRLRPDACIGATPQVGYLFRRGSLAGYRRVLVKAGRRTRPRAFTVDMLPLEDVARELGIGVEAARNMARRGALPVDGKVSGVRYVLRKTLEEYRERKGA